MVTSPKGELPDVKTNMDFIVKCIDAAIERYISDSSTEDLSLDLEITQLAWGERRLSQVFIPMTPEEKRFKVLQQRLDMIQYVANASSGANERRRRVRKACNKLREHILEMRPFNAQPSLARSSLLDESFSSGCSTSTAQLISKGASTSFGSGSIEKHVAEVKNNRNRASSPLFSRSRSASSKK
ncbi:hypothetical protein L596_015170 [Steinernema carpocapsae]|uniref:Uncharacterized protein n=1 Tax=Steinernema carpocapsae TaxID=34508 RepID=A0A4U5NE71_STECR|nr:hypothetical protein L596_015170 [Steinernema carpocapsae]